MTHTSHTLDDHWAQLPTDQAATTGWSHHGLAVCGSGDLVAFHPGAPVLLFYAPDGTLRRRVEVPVTEAHGLTLVDLDGRECLWIADNGVKPRRQADGTYWPTTSETDGKAILVELDGTVLQELPKPPLAVYDNGAYCPTSIAVNQVSLGGSGDIWVADGYGQSLVHRFGAAGRYLASIGVEGDPGGPFHHPHAIFIDRRRAEPELYVADRKHGRIQVYGLDGRFRRSVGTEHLETPSAFATHGGRLIVAEHRSARLSVFDENDDFVEYIGQDEKAAQRRSWPNALSGDGQVVAPSVVDGRFNSPHGLAVDQTGAIYVSEWLVGGRLVRISTEPRSEA